MAQAAVDAWGRIDYLINNAARTNFNPFDNLEGVSKQDFLDIYAVNVVGPYQMIRAVEPHMRKLGKGSIVNDSSIGGVTGIASSIPYAASKAALNLMTKSLAHVLAPEIRINTVVPGMIQTRWLQGGLGDEAYQDMLKKTAAVLPLRRVAMPEDVAEVLVWFLEGAALVTGETLIVDSGTHLGRIPSFFKSQTE
jgi:3-oxoacyl-[acyl-carrier protein] reductase